MALPNHIGEVLLPGTGGPRAGGTARSMPLPQTQVLIMGRAAACAVWANRARSWCARHIDPCYLNPDARVRSGFALNPFRDDVHDLVYHTVIEVAIAGRPPGDIGTAR